MEHYKKLFMSFVYAFSGVYNTIKNERNLRIHLTCLAYMLFFLLSGDWFLLSRTDWAVLMLCAGSVISAEIFNTAVENAVNHGKDEITPFGKIAKDAAAGAVLVTAVFAVVVGIIILYQPDAFRAMFGYFISNPLMLVLFLLSIVPASLFIFLGLPGGKK